MRFDGKVIYFFQGPLFLLDSVRRNGRGKDGCFRDWIADLVSPKHKNVSAYKTIQDFWDFTPLCCGSALVLICVEAQHSDQVLCWKNPCGENL